MNWIEGQDIRNWSKRYDAKGAFPRFIGRLIRATTPSDTFLEFPSSRDVFVGGWDGIVFCDKATTYVPKGTSLWELGTETGNQAKAEGDYKKRSADPLGYDPTKCTFIFITTNYWRDKEKWRKKKIDEGIWKDIKVYDSRNLEEWFGQAPAVAREFSIHAGKYPPDGIQTTEDFWKEWSVGPMGNLPPEIVTSGREQEVSRLRTFLNKPANIKAVQAPSKEEAVAFIVACAHQFEVHDRENFFSRSLIVDTAGNFRSISNNQNTLFLISRIEETNILFRGVSDGHHVLVPIGADDTFNSDEIIVLPRVGKEGLIKSLNSCGLSEEEAERLAKESGRNLTVLKRLLKFPQNKIEWALPENARTLIPALLLGRWDENKEGDKLLLSELAGEDYETYISKVDRWKISEVPFIYQIGTTWRLVSPLDAWATLSSRISKSDLKKLETNFLKVLSTTRPAFDLEPEKRYMASAYGKKSQHTEWAREGLTQSLILIAVYGTGLELPFNTTPQLWVDSIISKLLQNAIGKLWASLNHVMPLIAEASPDRFLESISISLAKEKPEIMGMFEEEPSILTTHSHHTGLLWALEKLAWIPEYLGRVTVILGKLTSLDPRGKSNNHPINSLKQIFQPWMPQTFAKLDERQEVLTLLMRTEPIIVWQVLLDLLPNPHDIVYPTQKTRWRTFSQSAQKENLTYEEVWKNHTLIVQSLLSLAGNDEERIADLIDKSSNLQKEDRDKILIYVKNNIDNITQKTYNIWHQTRKLLDHHRSHPDTEWAIHEVELNDYQFLFEKLYPSNTIDKYLWMFDENWPDFGTGLNRKEMDHEMQQKIIDERRLEGLREIYNEYGIKKVDELARKVKEQWAFGQAVGYLLKFRTEELTFLSEARLLSEQERNSAFGFIFKKNELNGRSWINDLFGELQEKAYSIKALATFLLPLPQNQTLWNFVSDQGVEIETEYWSMVTPFTYQLTLQEKIFVIHKLLKAFRPLAAIHESCRFTSDLEVDLIFKILDAGVSTQEKIHFPTHEVDYLFEQLYSRKDVDRNKLALLEWKYLTILTTWRGTKHPLVLYEELAASPELFVEILRLVYKPSHSKNTTELELTQAEIDNRRSSAEQAHRLLSVWNKIPGADKNAIDKTALSQWVNRVRELAKQSDRTIPADIQIGQILAKYPEGNEDQWPPDAICEIIDTINSDELTRNFGIELFNKRGLSSRGPYERGNRERKLADYFLNLYNRISSKWPITASVFKNLSKQYETNAKREDERAEMDSLEY